MEEGEGPLDEAIEGQGETEKEKEGNRSSLLGRTQCYHKAADWDPGLKGEERREGKGKKEDATYSFSFGWVKAVVVVVGFLLSPK